MDDEEEVSGVHHSTSTSAISQATTFETMPLSMQFEGEEPSDAAVPSDLPTIYEGQVLSQGFTFQVSRYIICNARVYS